MSQLPDLTATACMGKMLQQPNGNVPVRHNCVMAQNFYKRRSLLLFSNYAKTLFFEVIKQPKGSNDLKNISPFGRALVFSLCIVG